MGFWILEKVSSRTRAAWDDLVPLHLKAPSRVVFAALALQFVKPLLSLSEGVQEVVGRTMDILFVCGGTWMLVRGVRLGRDVILARFDMAQSDNLRSRKMQTQVTVLQNVALTVIVLVGSAMVLMTFESVRQIGVSLLASAGIAGIILGFAAQKTIANLLAGVQLAITQPMRLDDVVIVEGEWGWIEEITLTYVVVKIWDLRRLVLPISYFLEHPFQNWTRSTSDILGTVVVHVDPSMDVGLLRAELARLVAGTPLWDGKVQGVQVTECSPEAMQVRFLVSASDSGKAWDLRCLVREGILDFLRREHPRCLPRKRVLVSDTPELANAASD
ncbi:MAG: mechanosensitive ion channel [Fibrobacteria bacterium]|nr:mechanosensitive ion channel [Fibrobacteria bacterium]